MRLHHTLPERGRTQELSSVAHPSHPVSPCSNPRRQTRQQSTYEPQGEGSWAVLKPYAVQSAPHRCGKELLRAPALLALSGGARPVWHTALLAQRLRPAQSFDESQDAKTPSCLEGQTVRSWRCAWRRSLPTHIPRARGLTDWQASVALACCGLLQGASRRELAGHMCCSSTCASASHLRCRVSCDPT